jgi:1,4-alpha-glucan branching enzyme
MAGGFRCDGLRFDATTVRSVDGHPRDPRSVALPDGLFLSWVTDEIRARQPWKHHHR